jgi:hypothetical protein
MTFIQQKTLQYITSKQDIQFIKSNADGNFIRLNSIIMITNNN